MSGYDLIVIGAGPGGYVAAIRAAQIGMQVALIEERDVGGTCLNRGCIPTKTLLHTANLVQELSHGEAIGLLADNVRCDLVALYARKNQVVEQLRSGVEGLVKANGIELIRGTGRVEGPGKVSVGDALYEGKNILLAAGSLPAKLPLPGMDLPGVVTSDELLDHPGKAIGRLVIIGGGVIGVEFASVFSALGAEVTIVEAAPRILPGLDREIGQNLTMILKKRGVKIFTGAMVSEIQQDAPLSCAFKVKEREECVPCDQVLVSVGRKANTEALLAPGVDLGLDRGFIPVDSRFETCVKGIYAIGDLVKGGVQLAHVASAQGINAVAAMAGRDPFADLSTIPSCIYTNPEIAVVGLSADEAKAAEIPAKTGKFIMSANGKTLIEQGERGFVKVVFHGETGVLLGAQLMCGRATDLVAELATAISNKLTVEQLSTVIRPHPTFCEAVTEAVEDIHGMAIHTAPKAKRP